MLFMENQEITISDSRIYQYEHQRVFYKKYKINTSDANIAHNLTIKVDKTSSNHRHLRVIRLI